MSKDGDKQSHGEIKDDTLIEHLVSEKMKSNTIKGPHSTKIPLDPLVPLSCRPMELVAISLLRWRTRPND